MSTQSGKESADVSLKRSSERFRVKNGWIKTTFY